MSHPERASDEGEEGREKEGMLTCKCALQEGNELLGGVWADSAGGIFDALHSRVVRRGG